MVGQFPCRPFAFFSFSLFSFIAFFSRRPSSSPRHLPPFARAVGDSSLSPTPSNQTVPLAGLAALPSSSPLSSRSSFSFSSLRTSLSSTSTTSSAASSTTSISTRTSSTARPLQTLPIPTTTTSSTVSTPASSPTTSYLLMTDVTPSTTIYIGAVDSSTSTTVSSVDPSSTESLSSKSTSSTQFWDNKGAVAATFVLTSLLALAFVIMIISTILKRQKAKRKAIIDAEFMPNYQDPNSRSPSPTPSITSSPLDPFKSREIVHTQLPSDIPVSSKPLTPHGQHIPTIHLTPPSAFPGPSRYLLPSQTPTTTNAAGQRNKSEMRVSMQSGYQPSFDSFYGAYE